MEPCENNCRKSVGISSVGFRWILTEYYESQLAPAVVLQESD